MGVRAKLTACAAAFVLIAGGCDELDERGGPTAAPTRTACPYVQARPSYLPWLDEGEEVPEPRLDVHGRTSYVAWSSGPDDPARQSSVVLRRDSEPRGGAGEPVSVRLEGARGYFYDGPGGQAAVLWKTDAQTCKLITLTLSLPGVGRRELRTEILKIVQSLESRRL